MRLFATISTMLLAGLLFIAPEAAWTDETGFRPAAVTLNDAGGAYPDGVVLLARGGHGGHSQDRFLHGGHRGHGPDRFFHGGHRHQHHFKSHLHRHHFDGRFGHFGTHRHFHPGFGVSFCVRDRGVLFCFNDHAFGNRHRW
jgi:hypothetical protein